MLKQAVITVSFCLQLTLAKLNTPQYKNKTQEQIIDCAIEIANHNFNFRKLTVVLNKDVEESLINRFLKSYQGTVIVESKRDGVPTRQVVVIVDSFLSFMKILTKLKPDLQGKSLLNNGAKFLVLLLGSRKKIDRINSILWSYYVTDAIIVTKDKNRVVMFTYYPYKNHLNCQNTEPTFIGFWNKTTQLKNLYPDKMLKMNECPLYISTNKVKYPLTEKKIPLENIKKAMLRLFREIMNFTSIISVKDYISIDSDKARNWSDSLSDVITGLANISTSTIPLGIDRVGLLDYSMPYFRVRLVWLAPPVTPGPVWWRLFSPLNGYLWLILLIVIFFVKSLPFMIKINTVKRFCLRYIRDATKLHGIMIWGVLVGQPIRVAPRKFRDFYFVGLWMWFTFVVRSAYQSVLIGALKTDSMLGNFANLKETVEAGYKFGGRIGIYAHFEFDPLISERFEVIPEENFEKAFFDVIEGRKKFVLATSLEYAFAYCLAQGKTEKECGHVLPDSIMSVPLVIWMKMHSPFKRPLAVWLPRLIESGLLQRDTILSSTYCCQLSSDPTPLTHHQMLSCMLCLFVGYVVSIAVFVLEVVRNKTIVYYTIEKKRPYCN